MEKKTDTNNIEKITTKNNRMGVRGNCLCGTQKYMFMKNEGSGLFDIHKMIGQLPRPKSGWTPGNYKYLGAYNPLHKQVTFNENTGEIQNINVQPKNKLDEIAMQHNICYTVNPQNKDDCDRQMVKSIDEMPYKDMNKMAMLARTIINKKTTARFRSQKKNDTKIDIEDRKQYAKEMHKRVIKKFQRRYIYSPGIDVIWTSDLILIPKYAKSNNGYKYILTVLDTLSKFA